MPKKLLAIIVILLLGITSLSTESFVTANFIPTQPEIRINTPMQTELKIYQNTSVPLLVDIKETVTSEPPHHYPEINHIYYQLDGQEATELINITRSEENWFSGRCMQYFAYATLDSLKDGNHTLTAFCQDDTGRQLSFSRVFEYSTQFTAPKVALLSPVNKTYPTTNQLPLTIIADDLIAFSYSLDNKPLNQPLKQSRVNITLTGLTEGEHTLNVNVHTRRGFVSQTANFLMDNNTDDFQTSLPAIKTQPTQLTLIISITIIAIVAVASVSLIYFRRGKGKP
jgi:hypothetical protein